MRLLGRWLFGLMTLAITASSAVAQDSPADECDRLAAEPGVVAGFAGVTLDSIDAEPAMAACAAAVEQSPGNPRYSHQYGRALERAGRLQDARRLYEWAAGDGYGPAIEAVDRLSATGAVIGWTEAERMALGHSMAGISTAMRRLGNKLPPDPSDPLTIIAEIGTDPATITEWVATHTRLIPYAGSLRGARGVLTDRNGNSLDRALALAALLSASGEDVRLARATLAEAQAKALLEASRGASAQVPALTTPSPEEMLELFRSSGVPEDVAKQAIDESLRQRARFEVTVAEQMAVLAPLLSRSTEEIGAAAVPTLEQLMVQQLQDHFWVQVQRGEAWIAFDPNVEQVGTLEEAEVFDPAKVPDQLRHAVTVRVIVELQTASGRREHTLVSWTGFTANQSDMLITLAHTTDTIDTLMQLVNGGGTSEQFLAAVDVTSTWTPLLLIGDQVYFDKLFSRDGQIRVVDRNVLTQAGRSASSVFEQAGEALGGDPATQVEHGIPTAEWIEVELVAPGQPSRIERRTLFDLLGPAQRASNAVAVPSADQLRDRALRLLGSSDMLVLGANPSRIELVRVATAAIAGAADTLNAVAQQAKVPEIGDVREGRRLMLPLRQFAQERLFGENPPAISAPNVLMLHQRFDWLADRGARGQTKIDIVFNDVVAAEQPFAARVEQGVTDSVLETAMIEGGESTARDTFLAAAVGTEWTLLRAGDEQLLGSLSPDLRSRVLADIAAGRLVLASLEPPGRGWWRIDPATGNVLAMGWEGGGEVMAGEALIIRHVISAGICLAGVGVSMVGSGTRGEARVGAVFCVVAAAAAGAPAAIRSAGLVSNVGMGLGVVWALFSWGLATSPNLPQ